ncbi:hypothetical protein MUN78_06670 [Leucobacter allii]|uniref:DNA-binding protein n=1 Tax=Leucobacter allii TaxID=2932247 RepID=A0ABY4FQF5_9MICO|nr:hypothetical protein [Leucobacter allii]UOQ58507.1 hypothetical protein MUN78_06670 [Leucobacter allii]
MLALVDRIADDELDAVAEALTSVVERRRAGARAFTRAEAEGLAALGVPASALDGPPRISARLGSALAERALERDALGAVEVAEILGVSAARVRQRAAEGSLIARRTRAGWVFPALQFPERREFPGWASVARAFPPGTPLLLVERILTRPSPHLVIDDEELSPFEWLEHGGDPEAVAAVVDAALHRVP